MCFAIHFLLKFLKTIHNQGFNVNQLSNRYKSLSCSLRHVVNVHKLISQEGFQYGKKCIHYQQNICVVFHYSVCVQ